jgi:hypothetical protein
MPKWSVSRNPRKWFKTEAFKQVGKNTALGMTCERSKELRAVRMLTGASFGMETNVPSERRICAGSIGTLVE